MRSARGRETRGEPIVRVSTIGAVEGTDERSIMAKFCPHEHQRRHPLIPLAWMMIQSNAEIRNRRMWLASEAGSA